jgi:hypothetical protein
VLHGSELIVFSFEDGLYTLDAITGDLLEKRSLGPEELLEPPLFIGDLILLCTRDPEGGGQYGTGILTAYRAAPK